LPDLASLQPQAGNEVTRGIVTRMGRNRLAGSVRQSA
jgi:hypothetical protein